MESLVESLVVLWGLGFVQWVQSFRNPFLDSFFLAINYLGDAYFFLVLIPLFYWCIHKKFGYRFALVLGFSTYLNLILKDLFATPRPYEYDSNLYLPAKETTYGIPSFHAQQATLTWGYVSTQFKVRWLWVLAILIPLSVSIGRMYVGVHFPQDVIVGAGIGLALFAGYAKYEPRAGEWFTAHASLAMKLIVATLVPLALATIRLTLETATNLGTLMGFAVGLVLEEEFVRFDTRGEWWKQIVKFGSGAIVLLGLQQGLKLLMPEAPVTNYIRYSILGFWLALGAPWVFVRAGLAARV
jgi:membrane-associated phospholipid phosphatase